MPLEVLAPSVTYSLQAARLWVRNRGALPVTAWSLQRVRVFPDGAEIGAARLTEDVYLGASLSSTLLTTERHEYGALEPGQRRQLSVSLREDSSNLEGSWVEWEVIAVVFADLSYAGSASVVEEIFARRAAELVEREHWLAYLEALAPQELALRSPGELAQLEAALRRHGGSPFEQLAGVKETLLANLGFDRRLVAADLTAPIDAVDDLRQQLLKEAEAARQALPADFPREVADLRSLLGLGLTLREDPPGGEGPGSLDCDCGGGIVTSVATEYPGCVNGAFNIQETWAASCQTDTGSIFQTHSGTLLGYGQCGSRCSFYYQCPPVFSAVSTNTDEAGHHWRRSVSHSRKVNDGVCGTACQQYQGAQLRFDCPCRPEPSPLCGTEDSPILIDLDGRRGFRLTDAAEGVAFDLDADGSVEQVAWTAVGSGDAWLALDRNGNGTIDDGSELFGTTTPQPPSEDPHGYRALAVFDLVAEGGDGDGQITALDSVYADLLLWIDADHDGFATENELIRLADSGIVSLDLDYHESRRSDRYGNRFRLLSQVRLQHGPTRLATDVWLLKQ